MELESSQERLRTSNVSGPFAITPNISKCLQDSPNLQGFLPVNQVDWPPKTGSMSDRKQRKDLLSKGLAFEHRSLNTDVLAAGVRVGWIPVVMDIPPVGEPS